MQVTEAVRRTGLICSGIGDQNVKNTIDPSEIYTLARETPHGVMYLTSGDDWSDRAIDAVFVETEPEAKYLLKDAKHYMRARGIDPPLRIIKFRPV